MEFLLFVLLNGAVAANAALIARRFRPGFADAAGDFLAGTTIFCFQVVLTSTVLGHIGQLSLYNMLAAQLIILFVTAAYVLYTEGDRFRVTAGEEGKTGTGDAAFTRCLYLFFPAAACFAGLGLLFVYCAVSPPPPTDAFLYHLVFPAEWLKSGRISIVQTLSTDQASSYYPANAELLYLWLMLPFRDDVAARFLQWLFAVVCVAGGWGIVRRVGLGRTAAAAAAAATLLTPGFFRQVVNCDADIVFTAFFLMAVYFLLNAREGEGPRGFILGGLAAGLMAGTKSVGVLYCALLLPLAVSAAVRARREGRGSYAGTFDLWLVCIVVAGGYWYLRNLAVTGSPFYPLGLSIGGLNIFPGAYGREAMIASYLHVDTSSFDIPFDILREHILGVPLLVSAIAVASAGLIVRLKNKGDANEWEARNKSLFFYLICLPFFATLIFWFVNPYNTHNNYRFLLPVVFFFHLLILCAFCGEGLGGKFWPLVLVCGAAAGVFHDEGCGRILRAVLDAITGGSAPYLGNAQAPAFLAILFLLCCLAAAIWNKKNFIKTSAIIISIIALYFLVSARTEYLQASRYDWYSAHYLGAGWKALEENVKGPARVAYAGNPAPYGLYGNGLKNNVLYVNLDGSALKFHDYEMEKRKENEGKPFIKEAVGLDYVYRSEQNFEKWHEALLEQKVEYLFVSKQFFRGHIEMPVEGRWALWNRHLFRQVFHQDDVWIFRVKTPLEKNDGKGLF